MAFTNAQWKSLAITPHFTSALSMLGDVWVVFDIILRRKKKKKWSSLTSFHRIIMLMSIWDFVVISLGKFPASWAMPEDTPNVYFASGNRQTCTMQGFFVQFALIVPIYNAMTSLYYLLVVRYGLNNRVIQEKYEKWMHICPFLIAFSLAIVGLFPSMLLYSTSTMWCWMNVEPKGCTQTYEGLGPTTCTRGDNAFIYRLAFYYAPIWLCITFATGCMISIYNFVKVQEASTNKFQAQRFSLEDERREKKQKQTNEVAKQAYFYIGGFLLVWTVPTVNRILGFFGKKYYPLMLLHSIFSPLQGFVNFIVYTRPRLIQHIVHHRKNCVSSNEGMSSTVRAIWMFFIFASEKKVRRENVLSSLAAGTEMDAEDYGSYIVPSQGASQGASSIRGAINFVGERKPDRIEQENEEFKENGTLSPLAG